MSKILVACEESQAVTKELRRLGHNAYSCDIAPSSGGRPEWHLQCDVLEVLYENWDMIIAFPPCTYLSYAATHCWNAPGREKLRNEASEFFMKFVNHPCKKIAIENPVGYMNTIYRKPDQIIQPYYFGDPFQKRTCLWLKNLPPLDYSNTIIEKPEAVYIRHDGKSIHWTESISKGTSVSKEDRQKLRSKTFPGIARAMAEQWTNFEEVFN